MILTADWHLTDVEDEAYRWDVFDRLLNFCNEMEDYDVYILGDLCDRKDRHSSLLVNKLIKGLRGLVKAGCHISILMGNHDMPLSGVPYWTFLSNLDGVKFYTKPVVLEGITLFPFTNDFDGWLAKLASSDNRLFFIHQPVSGAVLESGTRLSFGTDHLPPLPASSLVFAGDIHTPQSVDAGGYRVNYVGAPHPVKYGDDYKTRFLQIDDDGRVLIEHYFRPTKRHMIRLTYGLELLDGRWIREGDYAKIVYELPAEVISEWLNIRTRLETWAADRKVILKSIYPIIEHVPGETTNTVDLASDPTEVFEAFCETEGITGSIHDFGLQMLNEEING